MRDKYFIIEDLLKTLQSYRDWVEGMVFDRVPYDGKRKEFDDKFEIVLSELKDVKESEAKDIKIKWLTECAEMLAKEIKQLKEKAKC